ncbi:hypothetical protein [Streptomyces sp. LN785]|uniref:hypothetical protein n=1 Tax=Streptomyces sp. LN785 TaxID=3112983 RepID=UPI003720D8A0
MRSWTALRASLPGSVSGGNPVVDGEGREQDEAISGGGLAGVLVEDLVVEVAEEGT